MIEDYQKKYLEEVLNSASSYVKSAIFTVNKENDLRTLRDALEKLKEIAETSIEAIDDYTEVKRPGLLDVCLYLMDIIYMLDPDYDFHYLNFVLDDDAKKALYLEEVIHELDPNYELDYSDEEVIETLENIIYDLESDYELDCPYNNGAMEIIYLESIIRELNPECDLSSYPDYVDAVNEMKVVYLKTIIYGLNSNFVGIYYDDEDFDKVAYWENELKEVYQKYEPKYPDGKYDEYSTIKVAYLKEIIRELNPDFDLDLDLLKKAQVAYFKNIIYGLVPDYNLDCSAEAMEKAAKKNETDRSIIVEYYLMKIEDDLRNFGPKKDHIEFMKGFYKPPKSKAILYYSLFDESIWAAEAAFDDSNYFEYYSGEIILCIYDGKGNWVDRNEIKKILERNISQDRSLFAKLEKNIGRYKKWLRQ